jgi:hypothetical protein
MCLPFEGQVILDPLCWGIIVQVKNTKISNDKLPVNGIEYVNVVQVMGIDSSILSSLDKAVVDSLFNSAYYQKKSFFFDLRDMTASDEDLQGPCLAIYPMYSLEKKVVITKLSGLRCLAEER